MQLAKPDLVASQVGKRWNLVIAASVVLVVCYPHRLAWGNCADDYLGGTCTYGFEPIVGKGKAICQHVDGVLNYSFTRFLDLRGFSPTQLNGSEGRLPIGEAYPSGEEFEAVGWQYPKICTSDGKNLYRLPVAEVDIDNDGQKETVVQADFNGDGRSFFSYRVFRAGEFDISHVTTEAELSTGQGAKGNYPSFVGEGLWLRLFVHEGTTYLLRYVAQSENRKSARRIANQKIIVTKYYGGGRVFNNHQTPLKTEDLCEFRMRRLEEK